MASILRLVAGIIALAATILFISSALTSWYTYTTQTGPSGGNCNVYQYYEIRGAGIYVYSPCTATCSVNTQTLNNGYTCNVPVLQGWVSACNVLGGSTRNNATCTPNTYNIVASSTAMVSLGAIFSFLAFILLIASMNASGGPVSMAMEVAKLDIVFCAVALLFGIISLILVPAGLFTAVTNDATYQGPFPCTGTQNCPGGSQPFSNPCCTQLQQSYTNVNNGAGTTTIYSSFLGSAYWLALVATIVIIVALILCIVVLCAVGGSSGGGGSASKETSN